MRFPHLCLCVCVTLQSSCRWMHWPKVFPGFLSSCFTQRLETEDSGGVWLPPYCWSGSQGAPNTHAFFRQPRWWKPGPPPPPLPHFSPASHRAGQVGPWRSLWLFLSDISQEAISPLICWWALKLLTVCCRLFGVFAVWLDDETLQKQEVYLPSLPPEYEPHRLAQVMQRQQVGLSLCVMKTHNKGQ